MISRIHRFHGHGSLTYLYKKGIVVRTDFLSMKYVKSRSNDYRLAVVVSKKVSKKAVVRNRIRRRIYEIIRNIRKTSGSSWPYDIAITVFDESLATQPQEKLADSIKNLLTKSKII